MGEKYLTHRKSSLGCDPEFFFKSKKGEVVGSEKIIPGRGLSTYGSDSSKIIIDGVQAELNPRPSTCREILRSEIRDSFRILRESLQKRTDIVADFSGVVDVSKKELKSLSKKSRVFGCDPDFNVYSDKENKVKVDPVEYTKRSAGGHIHLGSYSSDAIMDSYACNFIFGKDFIRGSSTHKGISLHSVKNNQEFSIKELIKLGFLNKDTNHKKPMKLTLKGTALALQQPKRVIPMLDIILGNTSVLLDRGNKSSIRRQVYGKAGDFRFTPHGLEYRTLSNFWLRSYPIMSFVFDMARTSLEIIADSIDFNNQMEKRILKAVDFKRVERAINRNNKKLAWENFNQIKDIIVEGCTDTNHHPLTKSTIKEFEYVAKVGLNQFFKENPMDHWCDAELDEGWERFSTNTVRPQLKQSLKV